MAKNDAPARRSGPSKAQKTAEKAKEAALKRIARMKSRTELVKGKAMGAGAAYIAADKWGKREADEDRGGKKAAFEIAGYEIDGTKAGGIAAIAGAWGVLGDDVYDEALFGAGLGVMGAHRGITRYKLRMAEPPGE